MIEPAIADWMTYLIEFASDPVRKGYALLWTGRSPQFPSQLFV
jgi:hypothetical protein